MEYHFESAGKVTEIVLNGHSVAAGFGDFGDAVLKRLRESKDILLNPRGMSRIDSSGLGTPVMIWESAKVRGGKLNSACLRPRVKIAFDMTGSFRIFDICGTGEAALSAFGAEP